MIKKETNISVVDAAQRRVLAAFQQNQEVIMSISGGKDSICMSDVVINTMQKYNIAFNRLLVIFFDEEAMYPDVIELVKQWRLRFLSLGAKFLWFCMPIRHYNCCNRLSNDESFYCWEPGKEAVWCRPMPPFAIRNHAKFKLGMTYQEFAGNAFKDACQMIGVRASESLQRKMAIINKKSFNKFYPLYDWTDKDVWLYISRHGLDIPKTYIYLYKCGVTKNKLRISQFFSIDTIRTLPKLLEFYPDLYERVIKREPNADLVMMYYNTSMFRSGKQDKDFQIDHDWKAKLSVEMKRAAANPDNYPGYKVAKILISHTNEKTPAKIFRDIYNVLVAGDPKNRAKRAIMYNIKLTW